MRGAYMFESLFSGQKTRLGYDGGVIPQTHKMLRSVDKTLGKTLKFRAVTLVTTLGIVWILTGNPLASVGITAIQQSTNTAVYYFFEKNEKKKAQAS